MVTQLVKLEEIEPGTAVVKDVVDSNGNLLFKAGVELSSALIARLKIRNITHVYVDGVAGSGLSEDEMKDKQVKVGSTLDDIFSAVVDKPLMSELRDAAKKYLEGRLGH